MYTSPGTRIWILLAKHFAAETSAGEESELMEWRKNPKHNDLYFNIKN